MLGGPMNGVGPAAIAGLGVGMAQNAGQRISGHILNNVELAMQALRNDQGDNEYLRALQGWKEAYEKQQAELNLSQLQAIVNQATAVAMAALLNTLRALNANGRGVDDMMRLTEHKSENGVTLTLAQFVWISAFDRFMIEQGILDPIMHREDAPSVM